MQSSRHGSLESVILNSLWNLEQKGIYKNTVKDVWAVMAQNDSEKRAYTTVKTVMDRLFAKKALLRYKEGKKFYYRTTYSNLEAVNDSLKNIAVRFCGGDLNKLSEVLNSMINKNTLASV